MPARFYRWGGLVGLQNLIINLKENIAGWRVSSCNRYFRRLFGVHLFL
jgi:hypothetical protein